MLEALVRNWMWLLFRAIIAVLYGMTALLWPGISLVDFTFLFAIYAVVDGVVALGIAIDARPFAGFAGLLVEALVRIGGGVFAMGWTAVIVTFPQFLAGWALLTGGAEAVAAIVLRRELSGEWPLPVAGAVSVVVALFLLLTRGPLGVPGLRWLVGPYVIIFGATQLALARRLRQLALERKAVH